MDGQIYLWPLRPQRNDVLPAPTRQRVNIIGPPCQGVTLFAGIVVALVDADNAGHAAAAMVEHGLGDLKPDAKFLEAAGNGAANIVQRPVGHTARRSISDQSRSAISLRRCPVRMSSRTMPVQGWPSPPAAFHTLRSSLSSSVRSRDCSLARSMLAHGFVLAMPFVSAHLNSLPSTASIRFAMMGVSALIWSRAAITSARVMSAIRRAPHRSTSE